MNERQIVPSSLFVARRYATIVFESIHETFDKIPAFVRAFAESARTYAVAAGRDDGLSTALSNRFDQLIGIIAFVGNHHLRHMSGQQFFRASHIVFFTRTKGHLDWLTLSIYGQMQFRAESAPRAAEGFLRRFFFSGAPAAC